MIYVDTSFAVPLYLEQSNSLRTFAIFSSLREPLPASILLELEFKNAINFAAKRGEISKEEKIDIRAAFSSDLLCGRWFRVSPSQDEIYAYASALSDRHSATISVRSLDLLQVATARILSATTFITFDLRQAELARAEGLAVIS